MNERTTYVPGLNRRHGARPLRHCGTCGRELVFCQSSAGRWYPVNVVHASGRMSYLPTDLHKCGEFGRSEPAAAAAAPATPSLRDTYLSMLETETDERVLAHLRRQLELL